MAHNPFPLVSKELLCGDGLELDPTGLNVPTGRHPPGRSALLLLARRKRVRGTTLTLAVGPGEGDSRGIRAGGSVDEVRLAAGVGLAAIVAKADADRRDRLALDSERAP